MLVYKSDSYKHDSFFLQLNNSRKYTTTASAAIIMNKNFAAISATQTQYENGIHDFDRKNGIIFENEL